MEKLLESLIKLMQVKATTFSGFGDNSTLDQLDCLSRVYERLYHLHTNN